MKIDPAMCMKTQETMTKCPAIKQVFTRKCTHCARIENNLSGVLAEMHTFHDNSGRIGAFESLCERLRRVGTY